jgi:hypothetical protein
MDANGTRLDDGKEASNEELQRFIEIYHQYEEIELLKAFPEHSGKALRKSDKRRMQKARSFLNAGRNWELFLISKSHILVNEGTIILFPQNSIPP